MLAVLIFSFCASAAQPVSSALLPSVRAALAKVTLYPATGITATSATLSWTPSYISDFKEYEIRRTTSPGNYGCGCTVVETINSSTTTSYTDTTLSAGVIYYFIVRVYSTSGQYSVSNEIMVPPSTPIEKIPPTITILSPQNITYGAGPITISWTVNETAVWIGYTLDGSAMINLIDGSFTLSNLTSGPHVLTIYANDSSMNMGNATVRFTVSTNNDGPSWLSQFGAYIGLGAVAVVAAGVAVAFYLRKKP